MRVAFWHFYTFRLLRGIETLVLSLSNALVRKGVDVSIVTAAQTVEPLVRPDPAVKVFAYPTFRYYEHLSIALPYVVHFLRHRYDHVIVFFADFGEGTAWRLLRHLKQIPLTLYLCYTYSGAAHRYRSFLKLGWNRTAEFILADAEWIAREAEPLLGRRVEPLPVGTDPERFRPDSDLRAEARRRWGLNERDVVMLNVSALERGKGTWRGVEAMARLQHRFPELRFFICGQGEEEAPLRSRVRELGLDKRVTFCGTTKRLEVFYNLADLFLMLADQEANSLACLEAMSSGLPVVVSRRGGFTESVPFGAGRLIDPDQREEIDAALGELISDSSLRRRSGEIGRSHVERHHSWDRIAERLVSILQGLND